MGVPCLRECALPLGFSGVLNEACQLSDQYDRSGADSHGRGHAGTMNLYRLLVRFFRIVNQLYFTEVHTVGRGRVPAGRPLIIAANHPSSILDSILLGTQVPRKIHYLAGSKLFRWPVLARLFRHLGAIPVYRRDETRDHGERNVEMFETVYRLLEQGGCVGIFPEGRNSPDAHVRALRTGTARIALGAEARNEYRLESRIVPVGITFEDREFLTSAVLISFGEPIRPADYAALHRTDPEGAVRKLTAALQTALRREALHIEDRQLGPLVNDLSAILAHELATGRGLSASELEAQSPPVSLIKRPLLGVLGWYRRGSAAKGRVVEARAHNRRHVGAVLNHAIQREPAAVEELRNRVDRYKDHVDQARLRRTLRDSIGEPVRGRLLRLRMTLYAVAMAPVALYGLVHNAAPFLLTWWASRGFPDEGTRLFAAFGFGVLFFLGTHAGFGLWAWNAMHLDAAWAVAYAASLPPTGIVALSYRRNVLVYRDAILIRTWFWNHRELAHLLHQERQGIIEQFHALAGRCGGDAR